MQNYMVTMIEKDGDGIMVVMMVMMTIRMDGACCVCDCGEGGSICE